MLAVLGFHKIGPPPPGGWETWNYIPEATFAGFLEVVRADGWEVIDAARFVAGLDSPSSLPERSALLTFDDGCRSMLTVAEPILARFGLPAVAFVPTDYVGGVNSFDAGNEPEEPILTWDEIAELEKRGVSIQSHACSHATFSALDQLHIKEELARSRSLIEEHLKTDVVLHAYPFGDAGKDAAQTAETMTELGYRAAFLYGGVVACIPITDRYQIPRIAVGPDTDLRAALA
ncbi:MAG: hypothetical protein CMJ85_09605 [Planctomycetes bacterium]|jgi:peptidoglycan/xylan/chitin deacetylase (PgdA/CDA1 family)|nr:hypothetical protein [Planctomycetota bacterium]